VKATIVVPGRWHAFDLAREIHALGGLHRLVTSYPKSQTREWGIPDERVVSLPLQLVLTRLAWRIGGESTARRMQFRINDIFARRAARYVLGSDVVHAWSGSAEPSLILAKTAGMPSVLERSSAHMSEQCRILREGYQQLGLKWTATPQRTVERELQEYELATRVAVPSVFVERTFLERGFPAARLHRNGFGVNLDAFSTGPKVDRAFRVVFAGSLSVRKGIHYLVDGFRSAALPHSELLLIGGHSSEAVRLLGPADKRIRVTGHRPQSELVSHYRQSSVFVMPSIEEGQAMVQLQALACGLPLICTRNTGGEDLLSVSGETPVSRERGILEFPAGYLIPPRDSAAIAECLRLLHDNPTVLESKRSAALALRECGITWRNYAKRNMELYEELICARGIDEPIKGEVGRRVS
jgi:starch synthase